MSYLDKLIWVIRLNTTYQTMYIIVVNELLLDDLPVD
jgi:hypothetical protein